MQPHCRAANDCMHAGGLFHYKKGHTAYSIDPNDYQKMPLYAPSGENKLLNEFFLYVLEDCHTCQGLANLEITSGEPEFVKEMIKRVYTAIPATPTCGEIPATMAFSRQLVAYIAGFLPVAMYFRNSDTRYAEIACRAQVHSSRPLAFRLEYQLCMVGNPAVLDLIARTPVQAPSSGPTDFATGTPTPGLQASSTTSTTQPSISCRRARTRRT